MRAIETKYKGYRFRSRLEARWAVFFDALGLDWTYEPEGFALSNGERYLPDFYVRDIDDGLYVEVKPLKDPGIERAHELAGRLAADSGKWVLVVEGDPIEHQDPNGAGQWCFFPPDGPADPDAPNDSAWSSDNGYIFCLCPWCNKVGLQHAGRGGRVCGWRKHHAIEEEAMAVVAPMGHHHDDKCYTGNHEKIMWAAEKARSARFEFGESG
jgi:hypothetical protein